MKRLVLCALLLAGCKKTASAEQSAPAKLLSDLAVFARGKPLEIDDAAKRGQQLAEGKLSLEKYIDDLLHKPMGGRFAKDLVIGPSDVVKDRHPVPAHSTLRSTKDGGETVYYLRRKCSASEADRVEAWWGDHVLVCPDSHRPTVTGDSSGRSCGASMLAPRETEVCGCGPHLMYCTKSEDQFNALQDDFHDELLATVGYVVDNDVPVEELFTMNESVRNKNAEMLYRRARIAAGESPDLLPVKDLGDAAELRPRIEQVHGQHAGVLSTPALTYGSDALRGVLRNYYDYLWCSGVASSRVTTQAVMDLQVVDLRTGDGWQELASMNICTDCHARLDYGMQFFWGYPSSTMGVDFRPSDVRKGQGPLYGRGISDSRGEDDLTPAGFARLATAQPEFGKCMTRKVVDHVFNGSATNEDFKAVHETFESTHRIKAMLKVAMMRYAEKNKSGPPPRARVAAPKESIQPAGDEVRLSKSLRDMLDDKCISCHDKDDPFDFNGGQLPHKTLALMLDQVGFSAMPKTAAGLDEEVRLAFVHELSRHVFTDPEQRKIGDEYFAFGMRAHPVHRFRSAMLNVVDRVDHGAKGSRPSAIETAVDQSQMRYTPSIAVASAVVAVRACKEEKLTGGAFETCIERATAPGVVIVGALGASAP
jgi:hypothetical protein